MQTWSNPLCLAVSGCLVDHTIALTSVQLLSVTSVQMLSYYCHADRTVPGQIFQNGRCRVSEH
nr:unnamed protein product [Callosobruchus chinensis]